MSKRKTVVPETNPDKKKKMQPVNPADRWTGHALDGSQQLDILEEQMYVNEPGTTIDQPLVPPKPPK
ncbi:hypothetical protein CAter282_3436 [Collimonas arenae]|uniref:Uncharacterized protein n=1 Tax=Collimonas arenae TaxID=279058 RepID=A0A127PU38_9BURK|nr:hypothetical protein [Collimonas arenae]AMP01229.1 hypothetical protein CAter10_3764 [Collimonas arenae]AMP11125.1 hypothetical protein CAter282_3436 [Collimonas arenae]